MLGRLLASKRRPYLPRFREREEICLDLSGTRVTMRLPPHTVPDMSQTLPPRGPVNIYDLAAYDHAYDQKGQLDPFPLTFLVRRAWKIHLSPFDNRGGHLYMPVSLIDASHTGQHENCLDQVNFEQTILAYLSHALGPGSVTGNVHIAPHTWEPRTFGGSQGIKLTAIESPEEQAACVKTLYFIPICDTHFVLFQFLPTQSLPGYGPQDFHSGLIESVASDIHISLPDRHMIAAQKFLDLGNSYSTTRAPEKWDFAQTSPIDPELQAIYQQLEATNDQKE